MKDEDKFLLAKANYLNLLAKKVSIEIGRNSIFRVKAASVYNLEEWTNPRALYDSILARAMASHKENLLFLLKAKIGHSRECAYSPSNHRLRLIFDGAFAAQCTMLCLAKYSNIPINFLGDNFILDANFDFTIRFARHPTPISMAEDIDAMPVFGTKVLNSWFLARKIHSAAGTKTADLYYAQEKARLVFSDLTSNVSVQAILESPLEIKLLK